LDADLYFHGDPAAIVQELDNAGKDVLITSHNFSKKHERISKITGKYCVQFIVFKNTIKGMEVLNWWRNACIDWCYDRIEDGKFGDQKYLDDWTSRFSCVHVCTLPGGGIAPWNVSDYDVVGNPPHGSPIQLVNRKKQKKCKFIFFHFHKFRLYENQVVWLRGYRLLAKFCDYVYLPYTNLCLAHYEELRKINTKITLPPKSRWLPRSFFSKTLFFLINIIYCLWKEKQLIIEFDNYHVYKIKNGKFIKS
jgi:hypothetical protein